MRTYKDFTNFINEVKENNIFNVKAELSNMIKFLDGDSNRINDAIKFAKENSAFDYDEHEERTAEIKLSTPADFFIYEKRGLLNNFSKERLAKVIELYHQLPELKIVKEEVVTNYNKSAVTKKQIIIATVAVVAIVAVAYKCLK